MVDSFKPPTTSCATTMLFGGSKDHVNHRDRPQCSTYVRISISSYALRRPSLHSTPVTPALRILQATGDAAPLQAANAAVLHLAIIVKNIRTTCRVSSLVDKSRKQLQTTAAIRVDPTPKKLEIQPPKEHKGFNLKKLTYDKRKQKLIERLNALNAAAGGADHE
ncbi:hypothetical protein Ccrd_014918 [Cynara cardunculus var. scolymus]|uniref:Large ribosomal subunit protein uL18 C-terminal eukaryotes domain-containing protein n=1 Tax=Cynara cardunculus var. scolymus TaxID=59895 RepID=A0A103YCT9_CYNCS|nr:hypothetical protein Ccrd_014918 [Cynara cardunculus var. scolymus]